MHTATVLLPLMVILAIITECALICNKDLARRVPTNYICLGVFTLCEAYLVAFTASVYEPSIVLTAACMTAGAVIGLTYYAWTTKTDFTVMGGACFMIGASLMMFGLFAMIFHSQILTTFYCFLAVILFGFYIIFDTQMIRGNKQYEINDDDYILAAMILYLDIIRLFIYILRILGESQRNN